MRRLWIVAVPIVAICGMSPAAAWQAASTRERAPQTGSSEGTQRAWELDFGDEVSAEEYARQIDSLKIEVAAISKNGKIEAITEVTKYKPQKRTSTVDREYLLRIDWKSGTLHAVDRKLLRKAGIASKGKEIAHYFPIALQKRMEDLERDYAGRKPEEIRRTRFRIQARTAGEGYEMVVVEQDPPKPADSGSSTSESFQPASE